MNQTIEIKPEPPSVFAAAIKTHRQRLGISQEVCARVLGVSLSSICAWERGEEPKGLTRSGALACLRELSPGDARLLPNHLRDRRAEA